MELQQPQVMSVELCFQGTLSDLHSTSGPFLAVCRSCDPKAIKHWVTGVGMRCQGGSGVVWFILYLIVPF